MNRGCTRPYWGRRWCRSCLGPEGWPHAGGRLPSRARPVHPSLPAPHGHAAKGVCRICHWHPWSAHSAVPDSYKHTVHSNTI